METWKLCLLVVRSQVQLALIHLPSACREGSMLPPQWLVRLRRQVISWQKCRVEMWPKPETRTLVFTFSGSFWIQPGTDQIWNRAVLLHKPSFNWVPNYYCLSNLINIEKMLCDVFSSLWRIQKRYRNTGWPSSVRWKTRKLTGAVWSQVVVLAGERCLMMNFLQNISRY